MLHYYRSIRYILSDIEEDSLGCDSEARQQKRLIEEVIVLLSSEFSTVLDTLGGSGHLGADALLDRLSRHMYSRKMLPLLNLWFEITRLASGVNSLTKTSPDR